MVKLKNFNECIKDNGLNLSGGQKKKILLMKLLAKKNKSTLILIDETEAGLDKESQEAMDLIERELLESKENYIVIKISHRNIRNYKLYNKVIGLDNNIKC